MLKGWKTVAVNVLTILAALLVEFTDNSTLVSTELATMAVVGLAMVNVLLRFMTTTPVGKN